MSNEERKELLPADAPEQSPLAIMAAGGAAGTVAAEVAQVVQSMLHREQDRKARLAFYAALAQFQAECPQIARTKSIPDRHGRVRYRYAPLEVIARLAGPALRRCGFSYRWTTEHHDGGGVTVTCVLTHVEGHSEESPVFMPGVAVPQSNDAQGAGATITYGKRSAFCSATGIMTGDADTDGVEPAPSDDGVITEAQAADLRAVAEDVGADLDKLLKFAGVSAWGEIPARKHEEIARLLEQKRAGQNDQG